jgi:PAS domain S-box-containing protein
MDAFPPESPSIVGTLRKGSRLGAAIVAAIGAAVLAGWVWDIPALTNFRLSSQTMKANTSVCFMLLGTALWLFDSSRAWHRTTAQFLTATAWVVAVATVSQDLLGRDLGIDQWLAPDLVSTARPGRMAPNTAILMGLLATAILTLDRVSLSGRASQWLALIASVMALVALCGYLYGADALYAIPGFGSLAVHTAFCAALLGASILAAQPRGGPMTLLSSNSVGGMLARRLLPVIVVVPIGIGWFRLLGEQRGLYGTAFGLALFAVSNILTIGTITWFVAQRLTDAEHLAAHALRRSQGLLQAISDDSSAVIYAKDLAGRYLLVNRRFAELFHVSAERAVGRSDSELFPAHEAEVFRRVDQRVASSGVAVTAEEPATLDDGVHTYMSVKNPLRDETGKVYAVFGISTDITDRKRMEQALVESQEHYRALAESLPHLVWTCRPDGHCDFLSRQWVDYTGLPAEEQLGYGWAEQLHPDDRARVQAEWAAATVRGDTFDIEFRIRRADGAYRWFKTRAVPLRDASGRIVKWFGSNTDFDDYKRTEQRLHAQLERLDLLDRLTRAIGERQDIQSIFEVVVNGLEEHLPIDFCAICRYDPPDESLVVARIGANSQSVALELGLSEKVRIPVDRNGLFRCVNGQLVHEPDIAQIDVPFSRRLAGGGLRSLVAAPLAIESQVFGVLIAARRITAGFTSPQCEFLRQVSEHVALAAHQADLYAALQRAYDDLRQTQQAVMQQERLKALGQMASGIAHDINNAISPVSLYTESLLETERTLSPRGRDYLLTIQRGIEDVAQTVARMREFYRARDVELSSAPIDVNRLVQDVVELTRARWSDMPQQRGVVIQMAMAPSIDDPIILGLESEIREALINLIFNAVDAMPDGGRITVVTRRDRQPPADGAVGSSTVAIEVTDTGVGMDPETRRRCLEPFFTTKGERGTGLGLAMVYGMVQRHSADIEVESSPGHGTTVRLVFQVPLIEGGAATMPLDLPPRPARLRILVVDDDPLLLKSLRDVLERDGHVVSAASGGQAGIDLFRASHRDGRPFATVITDLGMPHVDGRQVASAIKTTDPATPVILLTGWGQRLVDDADVPLHVNRVLNKPPKLPELRRALAELTSENRS